MGKRGFQAAALRRASRRLVAKSSSLKQRLTGMIFWVAKYNTGSLYNHGPQISPHEFVHMAKSYEQQPVGDIIAIAI